MFYLDWFADERFRPTMIMTGCSNIRELLGHKCSIEWIESHPAVILEKAAAAS